MDCGVELYIFCNFLLLKRHLVFLEREIKYKMENWNIFASTLKLIMT
jgi:hypothetical protein